MSEVTAFNGMIALGSAVSSMADVNNEAELNKSAVIVTLILASSTLSSSWAEKWNEDSEQYFVDSLSIVSDPSAAATAAAAYSQYEIDQTQGENEISNQNTLLQSEKSVLEILGNSMDQVYSIEEAPMQAQEALSQELLIAYS